MKLTLFTISNEQIKEQFTKVNEQLSKLQMKVESLETVKDVQDKIISNKDSQVSFLNDQIGNILSFVGIIAGVVVFVFGYVAWLNKQAQNKVKQAESLIIDNQKTATSAQNKLDALEIKQQELNDLAATIITNQKYDMSFRQVGVTLDLSKAIIDSIYEQIKSPISLKPPTEYMEELSKLNDEYKYTSQKYKEILLDFNGDIISGRNYDPEYIIKGLEYLVPKCANLRYECNQLKKKFDKYE
ncbi:hypothetical protein [Bacillus anthracis]|uniref:hypothetical protein n=1 Tax=Bacillus anthracis TaxID=1392 RepID=UPI0008FE3B0C|nr:hypothetical protein [Bacillus anthracis]OJD86995.1 hypothetical protein A9486_20435 [Bacillus anthracis]